MVAEGNTSILDTDTTFEDFGLDDRLLKACSKLKYDHPTLVQSQCIKLALAGKDVLARARTGSGKTVAYMIPIIQQILDDSKAGRKRGVKSVVLVPTRELCEQVKDVAAGMLQYCSKSDITFVQLSSDQSIKSQKTLLRDLPDIVVATPGRLAQHLTAKNVVLKDTLKFVVIDEADLILSYGYDNDMRETKKYLPKLCQCFLMSATINPEVEELKKNMLHNPAIVKLEESAAASGDLEQFSIQCTDRDKFLLSFALLRLQLISGKAIFFVNDVERCYRLRLFLEQFSISSAVLNSELPQNSRSHILQEFNKGVFDYLIATDTSLDDFDSDVDSDDDDMDAGEEYDEDEGKPAKNKKSNVDMKKDSEYGVARGVDFKDVETVINFDFPRTVKSYTHRIGRTARGGATGNAISFVSEEHAAVFEKVKAKQEKDGADIKPFAFKMTQLEGFRYRVEDVLRSVTRVAVREARLKEIKKEIINSEKLKTHFDDNPHDLDALKHDKPLRPSAIKPHLKHIPDYLAPKNVDMLPQSKERSGHGGYGGGSKKRKGADDPLQTFTYDGGDKRPRNADASMPDEKFSGSNSQRGGKRKVGSRVQGGTEHLSRHKKFKLMRDRKYDNKRAQGYKGARGGKKKRVAGQYE